MENNKNELSPRRKFLKFGLLAGGATLVGLGIQRNLLAESIPESGQKVKLMTADGKLVEVDSSHVNHHISESVDLNQQAREGIEGRKFIKVIDLDFFKKEALACLQI